MKSSTAYIAMGAFVNCCNTKHLILMLLTNLEIPSAKVEWLYRAWVNTIIIVCGSLIVGH